MPTLDLLDTDPGTHELADAIRRIDERLEAVERRRPVLRFSETSMGRRVETFLYFMVGVGLVLAASLAVLVAHRNGMFAF